MTTHEKIKWWLESRRSRYLASSIARELGLDETEVKIACADLSDRREIIGHEQNGVLLYYGLGTE